MSEPTGGLTLEEIEAQIKAAEAEVKTPPKLDDIIIDGEGVPEDVKGKKASEILQKMTALTESLRISEQARMQMQAATTGREVAPPPTPEAPKVMTEEEFDKLYQENPAKAIRQYLDGGLKRLDANFQQRVEPLKGSAAYSAEQMARTRYAEEFALFGQEIDELKKQVPADALARPESWEQMITYVRGKNIDKIIEHRTKKQTEEAERTARESQPTSPAFGNRRTPAPTGTNQLDAVTLEIAKNLGMSPEEYIKWSKVS